MLSFRLKITEGWSLNDRQLSERKSSMQFVLIIHEVEDYTLWKKIFDAAADMRREAGERWYQVLQDAHDPNKVVHFSSWVSLKDAQKFFESPELVKIRAEAGVKSPEFIYLNQLEAGTLCSNVYSYLDF
jgi:quinol monooxygenase YgiN